MTESNEQHQRSGHDSVNLQAGRDLVVYQGGVTIEEVRSIAELTVEANLERVRGIAEQVVIDRVDYIRNRVITELAKEPVETIEKGKEPDFQYALLDAEKAYARTGSDDLAALLVDMLIERTRKPEQSLQHLVLGEALTVAPKLTPALYDALTVIFFLRHAGTTVGTVDAVVAHYAGILPQFMTQWPPTLAALQHLEYAGCASLNLVTGYDPITNIVGGATNAFPDKKVAEGVKFDEMFRNAHPLLGLLLDTWQDSQVKSVTLTSVGLAIAVMNVSRRIGMKLDLSIWIN